MKSAVENVSPTRVKLSVEVTSEELAPQLDAAYKNISQQVNVPGFRKGKVPARIIDQRFGRGTVVQEAVNEALPQYYSQAVQENELRPLQQPEVNLTELPVEEGQDLKFEAELDIVPAFDLPDFSGIEVVVDPVEVSAEDVETRLTNLRERFGTLVGVDRPAQDGDFTSIDLRAEIDGEEIDSVTGVSYEIGSGQMLEGLDEALIGTSVGETVEFNSPLAGGDRAGQVAEVTVTLQSVKVRELPEVDDEFASMASEFDTVDEMKADLERQAEEGVKFEQGVQARDKVLDAMLELTDIPVPENMVEQEVHDHLEKENRLEDDEHRAEVTESSRKAIRTQFLLDALVERDEVKVEQNELVEYLIMTAQQQGMDPNQFAQQLDQQNQVPQMMAEVGRRKALAGILEQASVTDTNGETVDLDELTDADEDEESSESGDAEAGASEEAASEANAAAAAEATASDETSTDEDSTDEHDAETKS